MAKKGEMKRIFGNFADKTSMHGIGSLSSAGSVKARVFWSCVCLGSMGMFLFMLSRIVRQYLAFPVNVNVQEVSSSLLPPRVSFSPPSFLPLSPPSSPSPPLLPPHLLPTSYLPFMQYSGAAP